MHLDKSDEGKTFVATDNERYTIVQVGDKLAWSVKAQRGSDICNVFFRRDGWYDPSGSIKLVFSLGG
jgi:hypothetical protein